MTNTAALRPCAVTMGVAGMTALMLSPLGGMTLHTGLLRELVETWVLIGVVSAGFAVATQELPRTVRRASLTAALFVLAWLSYVWGILPLLDGVRDTPVLGGWSIVLTRVVVALAFVAAAWTPDRALRRPRFAWRLAVTAIVSVLGLALVCGNLISLPASTGGRWEAASSQGSAAVAARIVIALLWVAASVGFGLRAARSHAALDTAAARFSALYALGVVYAGTLPMFPADVVTGVDAFRILAAALLLAYAVGALRRRAENLKTLERRQLAELLHDGVAQELALIAMVRSAKVPDSDDVVDAAARRALEDTRRTIMQLTERDDSRTLVAV